MIDLDPFALAARQFDLDHEATSAMPVLATRKKAKLAPSPHTFLRGSATLFYEILAARPDLAGGPEGDGFIVGDMHLENVGAYRNDADDVVFGLNDFDDAGIGPLRLDVLRLSVSVLLAGRGFRATGAESIALVERLVAGYSRGAAGGPTPDWPAAVHALVAGVRDRNRKKLLDGRAPLDAHGKRRFVRGDRYIDLPRDVAARTPEMVAAYVAALGDRAPKTSSEWKVEDAAIRVAGNGSLGVLRIALLVGDLSGAERLVELKEARLPSTNACFPEVVGAWQSPADRVVTSARALLSAPPRHLAAITVDGRSYVGRRLFPQEDKLVLDEMHDVAALGALVQLIGHILGASHARGLGVLHAPAPKPWSAAEVGAMIDRAVVLAGMIEGIYLAWSRRHA